MTKDGIYKQLGDVLRANPYLSCNTTSKCLDHVLAGKNHVYPSVYLLYLPSLSNNIEAYIIYWKNSISNFFYYNIYRFSPTYTQSLIKIYKKVAENVVCLLLKHQLLL